MSIILTTEPSAARRHRESWRGQHNLATFRIDARDPDGELPIHGLTQDAGGDFYGTTAYGGTVGQGVVYRLTTDGTEAGSHLIPLVYLNTGSGTAHESAGR